MRTRALTAVLGVLAALLTGTSPAAAGTTTAPEATVVPIQVTGPAASRFNLVVMGDGYTAAELPKFRQQVDKHLNILWSIEPFKSYRNYVNVYAVEIASPESGVDCDPNLTSPQRDTPLQMGFWGGCNPGSVQRLLTVSSAAATQYADLVPGTTAGNRQILAIGNSDTYGGAGGTSATASGGKRVVPWDDVPPGYGRHQVEYRAIDATGNIGTPRRFAVTLLRPAPACTTTITGSRDGALYLRTGTTCLTNATVNGPVVVAAGASLVATDSRIAGPLRADQAADVQLLRSTIAGPVSADAVTRSVVVVGATIQGPVSVTNARTTEPATLAGNTVDGPLTCTANSPAPSNLQAPNQVSGPRSGQCARL